MVRGALRGAGVAEAAPGEAAGQDPVQASVRHHGVLARAERPDFVRESGGSGRLQTPRSGSEGNGFAKTTAQSVAEVEARTRAALRGRPLHQLEAYLQSLDKQLRASGLRIGSHDDRTAIERATWRARGAEISEFPETQEAAEAARAGRDHIILGAPNVVRGGSHKGNASALDLIAMGLCDALASDYHYPSPRRAALMLARSGVLDLTTAWGLVSSGPARLLGMSDRGDFTPGKRADMVILDKARERVAATLSGGRVSYMSGGVATRFMG